MHVPGRCMYCRYINNIRRGLVKRATQSRPRSLFYSRYLPNLVWISPSCLVRLDLIQIAYGWRVPQRGECSPLKKIVSRRCFRCKLGCRSTPGSSELRIKIWPRRMPDRVPTEAHGQTGAANPTFPTDIVILLISTAQ